MYSTLVRPCTAYYVISVRRFGSLPAKVPHLDIRLPSDSTSRWTPLPSANASYCRARSGLSPPSCYPCRAHYKRPLSANCRQRPLLFVAQGFHSLRTQITVPLLYQTGMEHHVFSWRFMPLKNQEIQPILTFMKTNSASLTYEIRASALNT